MTLSETHLTNVTPVNDDINEHQNVHIFNYNLNDKKTRKKLYDGAKEKRKKAAQT